LSPPADLYRPLTSDFSLGDLPVVLTRGSKAIQPVSAIKNPELVTATNYQKRPEAGSKITAPGNDASIRHHFASVRYLGMNIINRLFFSGAALINSNHHPRR